MSAKSTQEETTTTRIWEEFLEESIPWLYFYPIIWLRLSLFPCITNFFHRMERAGEAREALGVPRVERGRLTHESMACDTMRR